MHLLIKQKKKFGLLFTLFSFGKGTRKACDKLLVLQAFRVTGAAAYSFKCAFPTATLYQYLFSTSSVYCFSFL
jgi:hypothetical protein